MITHFLGAEEVAAFCRDLAKRLVALESNFPYRWFPIGLSGAKIADVLLNSLDDDHRNKIVLSSVYCNRADSTIQFEDTPEERDVSNAPVLLIDSAVHSGQTMARISRKLWSLEFPNIITYSLMVKRTSVIIPSYFGVLVGDRDRVFFQLEEMPNNRLNDRALFGVLREVSSGDAGKSLDGIGPPFGDTHSMSDFIYDKETRGYRTYLYEHAGNIAGFITIGRNGKDCFIDSMATVPSYRKKGVSTSLMRWAETWARANKCDTMTLWAFPDAIPTYVHFEYKEVPGKTLSYDGMRQYHFMVKKLIYNDRITANY